MGLPARAEELGVLAGQRPLVRGAEEVAAEDLGVLVVEDRGLDGALQEIVGVAAEELVERVLARDVHRQPPPAPPRATPHLPQRGDGPGERDDDRGVELADVDPELERVGCDYRTQLAAHEAPLELAALLGGVAGAVGSDELGELRVGVFEVGDEQLVEDLDALARLHEADQPRAVAHEPREQLGGLGERRAALAEVLVGERWVPDRDLAPRRGRAVDVDQAEVLQPRQALGQLYRVGDRRGGEQEARGGAVGGGDPAQAAQDVGDVRAEDAAVDVRLVDDDDREVREQLGPGGVVGEDADVEHVGVREHDVRALPNVRARLAWGVAVVDRRAHLLGQAEGGERARLVLGERLRRVEVQRARPRVAHEHVERRQVEAQRLARGGPGRDDRRALPGGVDGLGLMGVEALDLQARERREHLGMQLLGGLDQPGPAGPFARLAHEPSVRTRLVE